MELTFELLVLSGILVLGLILRYIPHLKFSFPSTPDTFFTLYKFVDPEYEKEKHTYPNFLHQFFRFFLRSPEKLSDQTLNRVTPLFDLFTSLVLNLFFRLAFGIEIALVATFIFTITPFVVKQGITLSSRPLGLFLFTSSLLLLTLPFPFNWLAVVSISLTLLTHKLSTQTLFVICLVFSVFDWQAALIYAAGFGFAILISKGHYLKILRSHITAVIKYMRGEHFPNQRFLGVVLVPTIVGFMVNVILRYLPLLIPFPIIIFGIVVSPTIIIAPYFENLLLIWGIICILLLIFWIAGEAYKHMYLAGAPFAMFSVLLLQNSPFFLYLLILLIIGSLSLSLYFTLRYQHLPHNLIIILRELKKAEGSVYFVIPDGYLRAGEYFSRKKGTKVVFATTTPEELVGRIKQEAITHIIMDVEHLEYTRKYHQVFQSDDWFLFTTNSK